MTNHRALRGGAAIMALATTMALVPYSARATGPRTVCVGSAPSCVPTLDAGLARARDGDTVRLSPGSYRGGVTITKNIRLVGAGPGRTVIRGGGPVLSIGRPDDPAKLVVTISDLTVSGGRTTGNGVESRGGGIDIPAGPQGSVGATVRLVNVVVKNNQATATTTSDSPSGVKCPDGFCPFARARGGGIANAGNLTLEHSQVLANRVDGPLSDANGGGIFSELGSLTVRSSTISGNRAAAEQIGRFAEGGGVFVESGRLTVTHATLSRNRADLITSWPVLGQGTLIDMNANSGAIHVGDDIETWISHTSMTRNAVSAHDPVGEPLAFDSAMLVGNSPLTMSHVVIRHNSVDATVATSEDVGFSGSALEVDGPATIRASRISDNTVKVVGKTGEAAAGNGLAVYDFSNNPRQVTVSDTVISGNRTTAVSEKGHAIVVGGGIVNNSLLDLNRVSVRDNIGTAHGGTTTAQGGGIWNGVMLSGPPVRLRLDRTTITGNALRVRPGGSAQGGGLYTTVNVSQHRSTVKGNSPDNCFGCR